MINPQIVLSRDSFSISISTARPESLDGFQREQMVNIEFSSNDFFLMVQIWTKRPATEVIVRAENRSVLADSYSDLGEISICV